MTATHNLLPVITGSDHGIRHDERDAQILATRVADRDRRNGPRLGDVVIFANGSRGRFTHNWGDGMQTTVRRDTAGGIFGEGSFHLSEGGGMSYSGALDPTIPMARLEDTGEVELRQCWFFHHGYMRAHSAVQAVIPCRVYRELAESAEVRS